MLSLRRLPVPEPDCAIGRIDGTTDIQFSLNIKTGAPTYSTLRFFLSIFSGIPPHTVHTRPPRTEQHIPVTATVGGNTHGTYVCTRVRRNIMMWMRSEPEEIRSPDKRIR